MGTIRDKANTLRNEGTALCGYYHVTAHYHIGSRVFIHSAKRAVLLEAELHRLMLLAIVKGGIYVTIIEDDYSRSHGAFS